MLMSHPHCFFFRLEYYMLRVQRVLRRGMLRQWSGMRFADEIQCLAINGRRRDAAETCPFTVNLALFALCFK